MTRLLDTTFERTLDTLTTRFAAAQGTWFEAWVFDDRESRRAAEATLTSHGVDARIRSVYKPLLHFFLEEVDTADLRRVEIACPYHPSAAPDRFRLETYPLAALIAGAELVFAEGSNDLHYRVQLDYADGRRKRHGVFAPNRHHTDHTGAICLSPTGWLRTEAGEERLETDYERVFEAAMAAVSAYPWPSEEPFFEELSLEVALPIADTPTGYGEEVVSPREALHEELYFSLLERFQIATGRRLGARDLRPGQIVPNVAYGTVPGLRIETRALSRDVETAVTPHGPLERVEAPLSPARIAAGLGEVPGAPFTAESRAGRVVSARHHPGADAPVMISGGQHANETTGVVGALRAGAELAGRDSAHFTLSPCENPDGYALHRRLIGENPRHMHHAARYTALGDDLEYRPLAAPGERAIRLEAERLTNARLHVNLHGYPSHEWTRPLTGYLPRGFAMWSLPKGFFLVVRHLGAWEDQARRLVDAVTARLAEVPALAEHTAEQIRLYELHSGEAGFDVVNGVPVLLAVDDEARVPVTLITEYPDETIWGPAFTAGHEAQAATVLAAYDAWQEIMQEAVS